MKERIRDESVRRRRRKKKEVRKWGIRGRGRSGNDEV